MEKIVFKLKDKTYIGPPRPDEEYVEAHLPDTATLAMYIKQAKGENRTMAEFANACKSKGGKSVSASTFSRILNEKITKPLSVELIDTIIENAENPERLNRDAFLRANGMVPESERERERRNGRVEEWITAYEQVKHIIADELYARDCMLRIYSRLPSEEVPESGFYLHTPSRLIVRIQGCEPKFWNLHVYISPYRDYPALSDEETRTAGYMMELIEDWYAIFLRDAWEPETFRDVKSSFVFGDTKYYEPFCDMMMRIKVNTYMSVILIDTAKKMVVEEKMIPRHDGKTLPSIFDQRRTTDF